MKEIAATVLTNLILFSWQPIQQCWLNQIRCCYGIEEQSLMATLVASDPALSFVPVPSYSQLLNSKALRWTQRPHQGVFFTSMTSNKVTAVPFNHITTSSCYLKENRSKKDGSLNNVLKFIKEWLRIPVVLLMLFMTTHGRPSSALAFSGGAMGGYSFSSSNSSSNWGSSTSYTTSRKEVDLCQDKDSDTAAAVVFLIALCVVIYWIMDKLRYKTRVFKVQV